MTSLPNVYENIKEANTRLRSTIVLYDGEPYRIFMITNHKSDGIFRVYLDPLSRGSAAQPQIIRDARYFEPDDPTTGATLDKWLDATPNSGILRKMMNSPAFNRFRPFPLGMCNYRGRAVYLARQPVRHREQGLTNAMVVETAFNFSGDAYESGFNAGFYSESFVSCVKGSHPSAHECITQLRDPDVTNESVAFHREFALLRGPIDTMFLAYKTDIVGMLPNGDFSELKLGRKFNHVREVVTELGLFSNIS